MDYKKMTQQILANIGGEENISNVTHCATRFRLVLKDESKFNEDGIKNIDGILNVIKVGSQFQLIVGENVKYLYAEFIKDVNLDSDVTKPKHSIKDIIINMGTFVGGAVGPAIVPMIGVGLIKALVTILSQFGLMSSTSDTYSILWLAADAVMQFWPLFAAYGVAKKLDATPTLIMYVVCITLSPAFANYVNTATNVTLFGLDIPLINYYNNFLPALFSAIIACYLEKWLRKVLPDIIQSLLVPFIVVLVMTPISLLFVGRFATLLGEWISIPLLALVDYSFVIVPLLAILMPFLIMFAFHAPIFSFVMVAYIGNFGYDPLFMPASLIAHTAMGAVALAVAIKTKVNKTRGIAISSCSSVWLGSISEPVIFGIVIQNKINTLATMAGALAGGLIAGIAGIKCYALVGSGLLFIPTFVGAESSLIAVLLACLAAAVVAFIITFMFYNDKYTDTADMEF